MTTPRLPDPPMAAPAFEPKEFSIVERPDGFYWTADDGRQEVGPFVSRAEAERDLNTAQDSDVEPDETLAEAESEIGIADWIDPDTGQPAEEERPRIEDR